MVNPFLHEEEAANTFEVAQRSLERLFPGFTEYSTEHSTEQDGQVSVTKGLFC